MNKITEKMRELKEKPPIVDTLPSALSTRFQKMLGIGVVTCIGAILIAAVGIFSKESMFSGGSFLLIALIFFGMGLLMILIGITFRYIVRYYGYREMIGEVTSVQEKFLSFAKKKDKISSFHIASEGKMYHIAAITRLQALPIHTIIKVYFPANVRFTEMGGMYYPSAIWGYSIEEEPQVEERKEQKDHGKENIDNA